MIFVNVMNTGDMKGVRGEDLGLIATLKFSKFVSLLSEKVPIIMHLFLLRN